MLQIGATFNPDEDRFAAVLTALAKHGQAEPLAAMDEALKKGGEGKTSNIDYHCWIRPQLTDLDGRPIDVPMP